MGLGTQKNLTYAAMLYEIAAEQGMKELNLISHKFYIMALMNF